MLQVFLFHTRTSKSGALVPLILIVSPSFFFYLTTVIRFSLCNWWIFCLIECTSSLIDIVFVSRCILWKFVIVSSPRGSKTFTWSSISWISLDPLRWLRVGNTAVLGAYRWDRCRFLLLCNGSREFDLAFIISSLSNLTSLMVVGDNSDFVFFLLPSEENIISLLFSVIIIIVM